MKTLGFLGSADSFSYLAAISLTDWVESYNLSAFSTISSIVKSLLEGSIDYALIPVENSIGGPVRDILYYLDLLSQRQIKVKLEKVLSIHNCLFSFGRLEDIKIIRGHEQVGLQCENYISSLGAKFEPYPSNAEAINSLRDLSTELREQIAAISHEGAGAGSIPRIADGIQDNPNNETRFWLLARSNNQDIKKNPFIRRASLWFILRNKAGALAKILALVAEKEINITRIESIPTRKTLGHYSFLMDLDFDGDLSSLSESLMSGLEYLYVLGQYPVIPPTH